MRSNTVALVERTPLNEAATGSPSRRFRARLIEGNVWGSSGYYSRELLESAVTSGVFADGTPIFLDHPTLTERSDRPERSVRDLAGRLVGAAVYESDGVYSDIEVYPHVAPIIESMAADIGMSIRASGQVEHGEAAGRSGLLVSSLDSVASVDFVTEAGAGGKVVSLLESARETELQEARNIGQWIESRIHRDFTITADDMAGEGRLTREERITLSGAIGDALAAFVTRLEADAPALYQRDLWDDPTDTVATALEAAAPSVPVDPAGQTIEESEEDTMPQIEEARLRELEEANGRVPQLETELNEARANEQTATRRAAVAEARNTAAERARTRVVQANGHLPAATVNRIVEAALTDVPLTDDHALDEAAFDTRVDTARTAEETYIASLSEAAGAGSIQGFGATAGTELNEAELREANDKQRADIFGRKNKEA